MSLPEDIENIEHFYRQQLGNLEVVPSKGLWKKVESIIKIKPNSGIGNWGIASIGVIVVVAIVALWPKNDIQPNNIEPIIIKKTTPTPKIELFVPLTKGKTTKKITPLSTTIISTSITLPKEDRNAHNLETITNEPFSEKAEETQKIQQVLEPEKPVSYYEKIKKKAKDSLHPIFVPKQ